VKEKNREAGDPREETTMKTRGRKSFKKKMGQ
jgi:hypothetical protein